MSALLSTSQAAKYLGISNPTLILYTRNGKIPASFLARRWRYKQEDLEAFVDRSRDQLSLTTRRNVRLATRPETKPQPETNTRTARPHTLRMRESDRTKGKIA